MMGKKKILISIVIAIALVGAAAYAYYSSNSNRLIRRLIPATIQIKINRMKSKMQILTTTTMKSLKMKSLK